MRSIILNSIIIIVVLVLCTQISVAGLSASPINIGIPFVVAPGFTYAMPLSQGSYVLNAVNSSTLAQDYTASMAVSFFPGPIGPQGGNPGISPVIAQTVDENRFYDRWYAFTDVLV